MNLADYVTQDALGLKDLIASAQVSAAEVATAALEARAAVDPKINAVVECWDAEEAGLAGAGPFSGVPFLIKDLAISMNGRLSELGSRLAQGLRGQSDSYLMTRFRAAGLVTLGRTMTPEMAISTTTEAVATGPTRNPWNLDRSAGGSSGGAGAAVAAGIVPIAHATDGGGSIRVPASANGIFGLKPTRGRVSNGPAVDEVWSGLAVQFAVSRSVRDSAALLDSVNGGDVGEPYYICAPQRSYLSEVSQDPGRLRIGFMLHPLDGTRSATVVADAVRSVADRLGTLGHHVEEITPHLGVSWDAFVHANAQLWTVNTAGWLDAVAAATGRPIDAAMLEPATLAVYAYGRRVSGLDMLGALDTRNAVTRATGRFFEAYDILLSPTLPELPPLIGAYNSVQEGLDGLEWIAHVFRQSPFTALANVAGIPAMSVPLSQDAATGLPIGAQFAAGFGREDLLFRLAAQLENAMPWASRTPPVWAGNA